jgi:16S rRNA processing protein RimM
LPLKGIARCARDFRGVVGRAPHCRARRRRSYIVVTDQRQMRVLLGRIAAAHGIRGEVLIHAYTEPAENIAAYGPLTDRSGGHVFAIECQRVTAKGVVARLTGVGDRSAAEMLKGTDLYVARDRLPPAAEGEFYHWDLVGLAAVNADGRCIGEIVAVQNYGAGDLLEVRLAGAATTQLIPFNEMFVPQVDLTEERVLIVLPAAQEEEPQGR